jgi:hypothetical protein
MRRSMRSAGRPWPPLACRAFAYEFDHCLSARPSLPGTGRWPLEAVGWVPATGIKQVETPPSDRPWLCCAAAPLHGRVSHRVAKPCKSHMRSPLRLRGRDLSLLLVLRSNAIAVPPRGRPPLLPEVAGSCSRRRPPTKPRDRSAGSYRGGGHRHGARPGELLARCRAGAISQPCCQPCCQPSCHHSNRGNTAVRGVGLDQKKSIVPLT